MYACVSFIEKYYKKKYLATKGVPSIFLNFTVLNGGYQKLEKSYTLKSKASRLKTFGSGRKFSIGDIKSIRLMGNDIIVPMGLPYNDSWSKVSTIIDFKLGSLRAILSTWF